MLAATLSIVSHGHGSLLLNLLKDLSAQAGIEHYQIIVTLNIPSEGIAQADYPGLNLILLHNEYPKGFGANHNAAFLHCTTPWFMIVNPDIRFPDKDTLNKLSRKQLGQQGLLAPRVENSQGVPEDSIRGNLTPWSLALRAFGINRKPLRPNSPATLGTPFYWVAGMFMAVSAEAFRRVGGFDERFFLYCEDYDLCARLYNAGYGIEVDFNTRVVHDAQRDSHRSRKHLSWHISSLLKVWLSGAFWRVTLSAYSAKNR